MDAALTDFARRQANVARRSQLLEAGVTRGVLRANLRARRWSSVGPVVIALHNGPLTQRQREWSAVLSAGPGAALGGRTSLALAGLSGWGDNAVHVVAPRGHTPTRVENFALVVHETRWPHDRRLDVVGRPPRTPVERSAIDAACWSPRARTAIGLLSAVVQQRLTTAERLRATLDQAGAIRHRRALRLALDDIAGGAEALSEIDFRRLCRRHQLGRVRSQVVRLDAEGRRRYLDVVIEAPSGATVACEVDGALHIQVRSWWDDLDRGNELFIAGHGGLRFPSIVIRLDEAAVVSQIRRALLAQEGRTGLAA